MTSQSKLGSFPKMIMPFPACMVKDGENEHGDTTPWPSKANQLHWVGSTSGGNSHSHDWRYMYRERLVDLVNAPSQQTTLLKTQAFNSTISTIRHLFDVAFTAAIQCGRFYDTIRDEYSFCEHSAPQDAINYRFLLDVDDNTWSGGYYNLLRSNYAVVKQGLLREFCPDKWIRPWVHHYFPLSMDGGELPELMRFLTQTETGAGIAEEVAREGGVGVATVDGFEQGLWGRGIGGNKIGGNYVTV
ncbi:MAG: hypothetical protein Q9168_001713 [Polycauliona sp. 1 TL-2023]